MIFLQKFLTLVLPPRCLLCGKILKEDSGLCDDCIAKINFIKHPVCYECGHPLEIELNGEGKVLCGNCLKPHRKIFRISRSACAYDDVIKKLILDFKFFDKTDLASFLAKMMYVAGKDIFDAGIDVIVPVPLYFTRLLKRKYNQSSLLAIELGKLTNVAVDTQTLFKTLKTKQQVDCNGEERLKNLRNAFALHDKNSFKGKHVLLVDDILTTGSTLKECALAIKKSHPKSIDTLTIARVL